MKLAAIDRLRWAWLCVSLGAASALGGCSPKIGDKCTISTDCSINGDRLCDPAQPGGYCTVFNCEPDKCPDEAVCVAFSEPSCSSTPLSRRFLRTFCMFVCESDSDCRAGYACLDTTGDSLRRVVDVDPKSFKICAVPSTSTLPPPPMSGSDPAVCLAPDAATPALPDAGVGGDGGEASVPEAAVPDDASEAGEASDDAADAVVE